jgi:hypothetical protein
MAFTWDDVLKLVNKGADTYGTIIKGRVEGELGDQAIELERLRLAELEKQRLLDEAKNKGIADKIKAYGIPLAIIGVVVIGGIATYFYFNKKKVKVN